MQALTYDLPSEPQTGSGVALHGPLQPWPAAARHAPPAGSRCSSWRCARARPPPRCHCSRFSRAAQCPSMRPTVRQQQPQQPGASGWPVLRAHCWGRTGSTAQALPHSYHRYDLCQRATQRLRQKKSGLCGCCNAQCNAQCNADRETRRLGRPAGAQALHTSVVAAGRTCVVGWLHSRLAQLSGSL